MKKMLCVVLWFLPAPGPGRGSPPGDWTPTTTRSCQMPSSIPMATTRGQAARRMRWNLFRSICRRPGTQTRSDLVRQSGHLEGVELAGPGDVDVPDLRHPAGPGGHQDDAIPKAHRLANVVSHEDDRLAGFLPDAVEVGVQRITGQRIERRERP